MKGDAETWKGLQDAYRDARAKKQAIDVAASVRWGAEWKTYGGAKAKNDWKRADAAQDRAASKIYAWLDQFSPWDWHSLVSVSWTCDCLTYDVAVGLERPWLPTEACSWGMPQRVFQPRVKAQGALVG